MSNLHDYAKSELERIGMFNDDIYNGNVAKAIMALIDLFREQGHSGFTAPYTIQTFARLAMFKPLAPLTGEDDEWTEHADGTFQNKRCSSIFKDGKDGRAYDIYGKIFSEDGGETWYSNINSHVFIDFPYVVPEHPEKIYLNPDREVEK